MKIVFSSRFVKEYRNLSKSIQILTDKQLRFLAIDFRHPSLRVKKVQGVDAIFEGRVTRSYRFTFHFEEDALVLRRVGEHDKTLKNP
jgi:mRNA-degrading endonuclease RelE of RelBE toxin-antitoxin system